MHSDRTFLLVDACAREPRLHVRTYYTMGAKAVFLAVIAAASVLVYWNTFYCGFVFDDHRAILTNDDLDASKTSVWGLFTNDFWGGLISRRESHKSYRPLTVLTYRYFNHHFFGLEPAGYHVVNLVLHAIASLLFLLVAEVALGTGGWWATYAALLFATHSVHTEAVSRPDLFTSSSLMQFCIDLHQCSVSIKLQVFSNT